MDYWSIVETIGVNKEKTIWFPNGELELFVLLRFLRLKCRAQWNDFQNFLRGDGLCAKVHCKFTLETINSFSFPCLDFLFPPLG